ncbi:MAG TPA: FAD-dependent monooxygenase [Acidimicrobiales bacterium]|nr:FAD-dependent monooxygenase [Acidimicrobiales bacterium]
MALTPSPTPSPPILVVGAGPVGLAAALALRAEGLPVTVLEAEAEGRQRPGSRAIFIHRESLQHLEAISEGLGWALARTGLVWSTKRTFWGERQVYERTYQPPDPHVLPHSTNLSQVAIEGLMFDAAKRAGVGFAWSQAVTGVAATPGGVTLTTEGGATWEAPYVIGADGARSAVRRGIGVELAGDRAESSFVIVDVAEDEDRPLLPERVYYYEHPAVERRNVLLVPFAGGWRADLMLREDDDPDDFDDEDGVRSWIARVLPERYADRVTWVSTYRFHQVVAERLTDDARRVLLVGEAAHLFAPFGARGLNSGIPDARAAAAAVRAARDDPAGATAAVDRFAATRHAAAVYNRDAAAQALAHMRARSLGVRARRRLAATLALAGNRAGAWLDSAPYGPRAGARRPPGATGTY